MHLRIRECWCAVLRMRPFAPAVRCRVAFPACVLAGLLLSVHTYAESRQFGEYEVFYSIFSSSFLRPEIAEAYDIVRAADRAVLNITVRRKQHGRSVAVGAGLSAVRSDLINRMPLQMREFREPGAIYYLGEFSYKNGDTHYFSVSIKPEGDTANLELQFSKTLYED